MQYKPEELLVLVKELTEKYTSKESTSVSYDTARQLLGAVIYCIKEGTASPYDGEAEGTALLGQNALSAQTAYKIGFQNILEKVNTTRNLYNNLTLLFHSYGNLVLEESVTKALPAFFKWYNPRFHPQSNIIDLDYPIPTASTETGIHAVYEYVSSLYQEQLFLNDLPFFRVQEILSFYHPQYRDLPINLCHIVLKQILIYMLLGLPFRTEVPENINSEMLRETLSGMDKERLSRKLTSLLSTLIQDSFQGYPKLEAHLQFYLPEIATELIHENHREWSDSIL